MPPHTQGQASGLARDADGTASRLRDALNQRFHEAVLLSVVEGMSHEEQSEVASEVDHLTVRLDALVEATRHLHESSALDPLLARLIELVTTAFDADRSTLFLYDRESRELFARVAQGGLTREIRFDAQRGIAGWVFTHGRGAIVNDAYGDDRFNPDIDSQTGYLTQSILCVPVRLPNGEIVGVIEVLNKKHGSFSVPDKALLEAFASQTSFALEYAHLNERSLATQREQTQIMEVTRAISSELSIDALLARIMRVATDLLDAERSTLFLHDPARQELWSRVAEGLGKREIRIHETAGVAGDVFASGRSVNIADAYADPRFNPEVDRETGYQTRSILAVPIINKGCKTIGVMQVLNRRGGSFSLRDQRRLELLSAQSAIALDNARLFQDAIDARNYSDNILASLSNGVITVDRALQIVKLNRAACDSLGLREAEAMHRSIGTVFFGRNRWVVEMLERVATSGKAEQLVDAELATPGGAALSVNLNATPLIDSYGNSIGSILVLDDISSEKRMRTTMSRYMAPEVADELIRAGDAVLGGTAQTASVMFVDIEGFTDLSEQLGAQQTVDFLNRYFAAMADVIAQHDGILDKYIGDAIMAVFGTPFARPDDARNAVRCALAMLERLEQFNRRQAHLGEPTVKVRIGINTDEVVVGNIGCQRRMDYTVIGDGVNLASRLESANKRYGTRLMISESTALAVGDSFALREIDTVRVPGRRRPVRVFEVLGDPDAPDTAASHYAHYAQGLAALRAGAVDDACFAFSAALEAAPEDRPAQMMLARIAEARAAGGSADPVNDLTRR